MVTIRAHQVKRHISEKSLYKIYIHLLFNSPFEHYDADVEIDPTWKQLHMHAIVRSTLRLKYKEQNTSIGGYRIYYKEVGDLAGAENYIHKNEFQCHDIINEYAKYNKPIASIAEGRK